MTVLLSKLIRPAALCISTRHTIKPNFLKVNCQRKEFQRFSSKVDRALSKPMVTWRSVIIVGSITAAIVYYLHDMRMQRQKRQFIERKRMLGKASIGGPFELVDSEGKLRTSEEFKGQWLLIYFGFTHCPDICPDEIEKMVKCVELINNNDNMPNIQPLFISVDPARDTPEIVGKYIKEYSDKFIGLTGSPEQIDKVCKAFRVYYSAGPADEDKDYIVDHTIITYLIDPDGNFVDYYGQTRIADEVAEGIQLQMIRYKKMAETNTKDSIFSMFGKEDAVIERTKL